MTSARHDASIATSVQPPAVRAAPLAELLVLGASGMIEPVIAERVALAGAGRAHELREGDGYAGRIVLTTPAYGGGAGAA